MCTQYSALLPFLFQGKPFAELAAELLALGYGLVILFGIFFPTQLCCLGSSYELCSTVYICFVWIFYTEVIVNDQNEGLATSRSLFFSAMVFKV